MRRWNLITTILVVGTFALFSVGAAAQGDAQSDDQTLKVERAWSRPALVGGNGAVYLTMTNEGSAARTLVGAHSPVAEVVEIHETVLIDEDDHHGAQSDHDHHAHHHDAHHDHHHAGAGGGTFLMRHLDRLEILPKERVVFEPAGLHVMLINLTKTLAWDETFPLTLTFADGTEITVLVTVGDEPKE